MKKVYKGIEFEAVLGDISQQSDVQAVVNAANAQLQSGGGVAGALHRAAGPGLYKECKLLAPINPGEAVITKAYNLPNKNVIHCLGPVYGSNRNENELLSNCYKNALRLAKENKITSIAFPAISTGAFGFPFPEATNISFNTILGELEGIGQLQKIRFVLFSERELQYYEKKLEQLE